MATQAMPGPPPPIGGTRLREQFPLDPSISFLNHGSFGSPPRVVIAAQDRWRAAIEARPVELLGRRVRDLLRPSKEALAAILDCAADEIGFVTNATEGINAVLGSLRFEPGDELLTTTHVYNAVRQAMRFAARRWGATVREIELPLPCASFEASTRAVIDSITPSTRLVVIDHITSPTALILDAAAIARACRERGVFCLVDGAHAPGMIGVDLEAIDADAYAANLHKWMFAPKGSGMLWVAERWRARMHPCIVSHFLDQGFAEEFDWQGTRDVSAWIAIADGVAFMRELGIDAVMRHNHELARWAHALLCDRLDAAPLSPPDGSMFGSTATVRLPDSLRSRFPSVEALQAHLYEHERIEVPIIAFGGGWFVRVSAQVYNEPGEYERLAAVLVSLA